MKKIKTYQAEVCVGLKEGYDGKNQSLEEVKDLVQRFCDDRKLGVTITETYFTYPGGNEPGVTVSMINYPRYPKTESQVKEDAILLAMILKDRLEQERVIVVCTDETIMLGKD